MIKKRCNAPSFIVQGWICWHGPAQAKFSNNSLWRRRNMVWGLDDKEASIFSGVELNC